MQSGSRGEEKESSEHSNAAPVGSSYSQREILVLGSRNTRYQSDVAASYVYSCASTLSLWRPLFFIPDAGAGQSRRRRYNDVVKRTHTRTRTRANAIGNERCGSGAVYHGGLERSPWTYPSYYYRILIGLRLNRASVPRDRRIQ